MKVLITVHGINTDGAWQTRVGELLSAHFHHHPIKYPHYRRLGALKLLFDPIVLLSGLVATGISILYHLSLPIVIGIAAITVIAAHIQARRLRSDALKTF